MSGNEPLMIGDAFGTSAPEIFALTDEQILEMEPEGQGVEAGSANPHEVSGSQVSSTLPATATAAVSSPDAGNGAQPVTAVTQDPPAWLAREMKDPWVGDEARELWEGVQRAQRESAAYRQAFATPEDARALKEIYPGGVAEAKSAAQRARELADVDAAFFGAPGKPAEELRAGRVQLVERLYAQDPAAFREMVEAGVRILGGAPATQRPVPGETRTESPQNVVAVPGSDTRSDRDAQGGVPVPLEVANRYREFERATNADLEASVGGTIARAMEAALPNLRHAQSPAAEGQTPPLQARLRTAVREEVETALRSDASLGEQVARILSGRRLDEATRVQVVRLIDARARQLVPGAVRRVVSSWTQATLGSRKPEPVLASAERGGEEQRIEQASHSTQRAANGTSTANRTAKTTTSAPVRGVPRGRIDYRKFSDEQILGM